MYGGNNILVATFLLYESYTHLGDRTHVQEQQQARHSRLPTLPITSTIQQQQHPQTTLVST